MACPGQGDREDVPPRSARLLRIRVAPTEGGVVFRANRAPLPLRASVSSWAAAMCACGPPSGPDDRQAPRTAILSPSGGDTVTVGPSSPLMLLGEARDPQDGSLREDDLSWSSDIDGSLGTGDSRTVSGPSAGDHRVTLTATDLRQGHRLDHRAVLRAAARAPGGSQPRQRGLHLHRRHGDVHGRGREQRGEPRARRCVRLEERRHRRGEGGRGRSCHRRRQCAGGRRLSYVGADAACGAPSDRELPRRRRWGSDFARGSH